MRGWPSRCCGELRPGKKMNDTLCKNRLRSLCEINSVQNKWINPEPNSHLRNEVNHSYYDDMSLNLEQYLSLATVKLQNNVFLEYKMLNGSLKLVNRQKEFTEKQKAAIKDAKLYISHRGANQKCYSFDPPYVKNKKIELIELMINGNMLRSQRVIPQEKNQYSVSFHLPHQTTKSLSTVDGMISKYPNATGYVRQYYLGDIEVLKRRQKRTIPCVDGQYDEQRLQEAIQTIGCKPAVIEIGNRTKHCDTIEKYTRFEEELISHDHAPPCKVIQSINELHGERLIKTNEEKSKRKKQPILREAKSILAIEIHFTNDVFKEIIYLKAYSIESLIGNAGGYIGKFDTAL